MRILVVEDNEDSRILLQAVLESNGYEVTAAENGAVALEFARAIPFDLIVSDILMPEMDGYDLCRILKSDDQLRAIPFVFYSATYTDLADQQFGLSLGADRFLIKPMEMQELVAQIKQLLSAYQSAGLAGPEKALDKSACLDREYAEILAKKLEKKVRDLEEEQRRLKESENRYRRLVETLRDDYFFYTRDPNGRFTYVSPSITEVLGYSPEAFLALAAHYFSVDDPGNDSSQPAAQNLAGQKHPANEKEIPHQDGSLHCFQITESPVFAKQGAIIVVEGIAHDITKRRKMEKERAMLSLQLRQAQKMEAIGTLAGGIAHDFNNILTPIIGYTEMVLYKLPADSEHRAFLEEVQSAGLRAKDLVKQILAFSRRGDEERYPVSLQNITREALRLLRSSLPATIEIKQDLDESCEPVRANPTQIHQIVMNLCTNAYHAMRETGGILAVTLHETELDAEDYITSLDVSPGRYLRLEISDTGVGIDPAIRDRIFEPYFTTKSKDEGTGLGLSVVHGIVKNCGGHISVYSEPGKGTTFHVYLPIHSEAEPATDNISEEEVGGEERILLMDDDVKISTLHAKMLQSLGYEVFAFTDSDQAIAAFAENPPGFDLVITDMTMPHLSGAELARQILAIRRDTPVILCSGFSEMINEAKAKALGIREYIMKPFTRKDIAGVVRRALHTKPPTPEERQDNG